MIRKLLVALTMAGLVAVLVPSSADAATAGTVVFTAGADVCHDNNNDGDCTDAGEGPADFWAPVAPLSDCAASQPDLCDAPSNVRYNFSTTIPGLGGQNFCAGVASDGTAAGTGFDTGVGSDQCVLSSSGVVNDFAGEGPYCGLSSGAGPSSGNVDGTSLNAHVEWPGAVGGVLPLVLRDSAGGNIIGTGAVVTSGANPGTCGLDPRDNDGDGNGFEPTHQFSVTGYATLVV